MVSGSTDRNHLEKPVRSFLAAERRAPSAAREGLQLAKVGFEFELDFVAVGAYFAEKSSTNALEERHRFRWVQGRTYLDARAEAQLVRLRDGANDSHLSLPFAFRGALLAGVHF